MDENLTRVPKFGGLQIREDDCSFVRNIEVDKQCEWVSKQINCHSDSIIQYTHLLFCTFTGNLFALGFIVLILWLLYLFLILGTTADNFFCPSLSVIASVLHLSENIAGVTILAFGNGAPDIFTSIVAGDREMVIMFTELIGAGVFVTAIIAGSVIVSHPCRLPFRSFTRDCTFYIVSICWISYTCHDLIIYFWEGLSLIILYIIFIIIVVTMQIYETREEKLKGRIPRLQDPELLRTYVAYRTGYGQSQARTSAGLAIRSRAYSLQAKLDVAIAKELAMKRRHKGVPEAEATREGSSDVPSSRRPIGLFQEFLFDVNPINVDEWNRASAFSRTILVLRAPATFILQCLIPVVNETAEKRGWSKLLNCSQLIIAPILILFKAEVWRTNIGPISIILITFVLGLILATIVFMRTRIEACPKYHNAFAFLGFISAMLVVYVIANEVMAVLECVGYASGISDAMLGITLLAWGNSVGDLISNVAVARRGFPRMGYSACFGGPLFNTLLGLGISWSLSAYRHEHYLTRIRMGDMMPGCLTFLFVSLMASTIYLNIFGFVARRSYGYLLFSIYSIFMLFNILSEVHFIHPLGTDHRGTAGNLTK